MQPIQFLNKLIKYWISAYYVTTYTVPIISHDFISTHHKICPLQFHTKHLFPLAREKKKSIPQMRRVSGEDVPKHCDSLSTALNFENVSPVCLSLIVVKWDANCILGMCHFPFYRLLSKCFHEPKTWVDLLQHKRGPGENLNMGR